MAYPAKTRTQGKTTNTNIIMMEWQFPASVAPTLATGCTGNSSMNYIRQKNLLKNETRTKKFKTFYLPGFFTQRTLFHKKSLSNTSKNTSR